MTPSPSRAVRPVRNAANAAGGFELLSSARSLWRSEKTSSSGARPRGEEAANSRIPSTTWWLANHHVVEGMREFAASSPRGRAPLELVFSDRHNDLALLKSSNPPAAFAAFRTGRTALLGEGVISIG